MKHLKSVFGTALILACGLSLTSCGKENESVQPGTEVEDSVPTDEPVSLLGSRWVHHVDKSYDYDEEDITIHIKYDTYLDFHTDSTGLRTDIWGDGVREMETYEYTFDGEFGRISFIAGDSPAFEPYGLDFRYIAAKDQIKIIHIKNPYLFDRLEE